MYCVASPASSPHKKERLSFARWIFACGSKRSLKRENNQLVRVHLAMTALSSALLFAGGHLAILLAHLLPNSTFILVENKAESLQRAIERTKKLHLTNCQFFQGESTRVAQMAKMCRTFRDQHFSHDFYLVILENGQKVQKSCWFRVLNRGGRNGWFYLMIPGQKWLFLH